MSYRAHNIGQVCRIIGGNSAHHHPETWGLVVVVTGHPVPIGVVTDERSSLFGWPADTVVQAFKFQNPEIQRVADDWVAKSSPPLYLASPPQLLEPIYDGKEPAEWTEELRSLCGLSETVDS